MKRNAYLVVCLAFILVLGSFSATAVQIEPEAVVPLRIETVSSWSQLETAIATAGSGISVTIELSQNISAPAGSSAIEITGGSNIALTSGAGGPFTFSQEISGQRHFIINSGILTLSNVILSGSLAGVGSGGVQFSVAPLAQQLNMQAGSVITNSRATQGGGVFMVGTSAVFIMDGGTLLSNAATENGGGVSVTGGSGFTMISGDIVENVAALSAGGVHVVGSRFDLQDGTIYNNQANGGNGGGVFTTGPTTVTSMSGGMIQGNTASMNGGGLGVQGASTFTMTGGTIYDNNATDGGGVNIVGNNSDFILQGGVITSNQATLLGGGIHVMGLGRFTMSSGEITGNDAGNSGGGVNVQGGGTLFTMDGGEIYENTSLNASVNHGGGGVNMHSGTFTMNDGTIRDNLSASHGGGIRRGAAAGAADQAAFFHMSGGAIRDNTAYRDGGGLYVLGGVYYVSVLPSYAYPRITIAKDAIFAGNRAGGGAFRPPDATAVSDRIQTTSATLFGSPFNNFDINFRVPPIVEHLYVTYVTDIAYGAFAPPGAPDVRTETINVNTDPMPFFPQAQYIPSVTTVPGSTFTGWLQDGTLAPLLTTNAQITAMPITDDTTFLAQYGNTNHLVTFYWNYNRQYPIYLQKTIVHGNPMPRPADPVRSGHVFQGWFLDPAGTLSYNFDLPVEANLSLYARWEPGSGGGGGTTPPPGETHHNFLIGGTEGLIRPGGNITRAEVASIFLRIISDVQRAEMWSQTNPYPDVKLQNWFNNAVSTVSNGGLFQGRPNGTFAPNQPITRAELVTVVARFMDVQYDGTDLFSDIDGHWARAAINAVAEAGWIQGQAGLNGTFLPNNPITRAETAAVINRMLNRLPEGLDDLLEGMRTWPDNANPNAWYYLYVQEASNSHTYVRKADGIHESWVQLVPERPWALLQRPDSRPEDILPDSIIARW